MKRALRLLIFADLAFLLLLGISGKTSGTVSDIVYFAAFLLPIPTVLSMNGERGTVAVCSPRAGWRLLLPLVAPTMLAVMLLSALTAIFLGLFGLEDTTAVEGSLPIALINYALLPAVLEELLFRYLPMRLTARYSPRMTVIISALFFALLHCDLFRMPYAFLAGVVFMMLDLACGSVLPSLIIHFLNNAMSVVSSLYFDTPLAMSVYIAVMAALAAASVIFIVLRRREYISFARHILAASEADGEVDASIVAVIAPALVIAIINLL